MSNKTTNTKSQTYYVISILIISLLGLMGCGIDTPEEAATDTLLAEVQSKKLYLSELDGMIPDGVSREDSSLIINAFVERWAREALLLSEAEQHISKDFNIDKLVRDYRASLVRHNYEQILIEEFLDSTITQEELQLFYEENQQQYILKNDIVRCLLIKTPIDLFGIDSLKIWWKEIDKEEMAKIKLEEYSKLNAERFYLKDSTWYDLSVIMDEFPSEILTIKQVKRNTNIVKEDDLYLYLFKILDWTDEGTTAPLSYVKERAKKIMLRKRKLSFLEEKREDMYNIALRKNQIKIYDWAK